MLNANTYDEAQAHVDAIFASDMDFASKMQALEEYELTIVDLYNRGLTSVKPVSVMTADDLDIDL